MCAGDAAHDDGVKGGSDDCTNGDVRLSTLGVAIRIARAAHDGQVDKAGRPYIEHPLAVMRSVAGEDEQIVAVLHDVLEDTDTSANDLYAAGFPAKVVEAVDALTKRRGETLRESMARVQANPLARPVKLADIANNAHQDRLRLLDEATQARLRVKYERSAQFLGTTLEAVLVSHGS